MEQKNKELDLLELINKGFNLLRACVFKSWDFFLSLIKFHFKNIFILLPFLIVGVSLSFYQSTKEHRKQHAQFMLQINGSNSFFISDIINVLDQSVNPDTANNESLGNALKVDNLNDVKKVSAIVPYYIIDLNNNNTPDYVDYGGAFVEDTLNSRMKNLVAIRISSKGEANFPLIQQKIVDYLMSNTYLKNLAIERIRSGQEKINAINIEILALDSLRKEQLRAKGDVSLQLDKSTVMLGKQSSYYKEMMELKDQKAKLQADLILQPNVVSIYSGVVIQSDKSTVSIFVKDVGSLYVFGLLIAFVISFRKRIKALLKD